MDDIYRKLATHLEDLIMGYPFNEALTDLLKETYSPVEAQVALAIPNDLAPLEVVDLDTIAGRCDLTHATVSKALQSLSDRNMLYTRTFPSGKLGYALLQVGYGSVKTHLPGRDLLLSPIDKTIRDAVLLCNLESV